MNPILPEKKVFVANTILASLKEVARMNIPKNIGPTQWSVVAFFFLLMAIFYRSLVIWSVTGFLKVVFKFYRYPTYS